MGKSSTGKDSLYKRLLEDEALELKKVVLYTTRPMRSGEVEGIQYFFRDEKAYKKLADDRKIIEERCYMTAAGTWRYFTVDDNQIDLESGSVLMIGTLESYCSIRDYFGNDNVIPILIETSDRTRIERALKRENRQEHHRYDEMCRRFLADEKDFAEEKIKEANIADENRFSNENKIEDTRKKIADFIRGKIYGYQSKSGSAASAGQKL